MIKMRRMKIRIGILALLIGFSAFVAMSQETLPTDTFIVVKKYNPNIIDAEKIKFIPEIDDEPVKLETKLDYSFLSKQIPVSFQLDPIAPAKIKGEPLVKLYNGYAKLGLGNAFMPLAEVYYNNGRSKDFAWGAHVKYLNLLELNEFEDSDQDKAHVALYGKRFWKKNTVDASINYDLHNLNYYGVHQLPNSFSPNLIPDYSIEQTYNRIGFHSGITSTKKDLFNLRYKGDLDYKLTRAKGGTTEHNFIAKANLSQIHNKELYNLDFIWDYNQYDFASNNSILGIMPQITTNGDNFKVNVGFGLYLNAAIENDFHFYPIAEVKFNVIEDFLVPYAGVNGQIRRNNYSSITQENPFVAENLAIQNTNENFNLYGGFRGTLSKATSFNISGSLTRLENEYFYVKNFPFTTSNPDRFSLIYDDVDELEIKGELAYRKNDKIRLYLLGQYFNYETSNELEAWHRPEIKLTASGEYNIQKKIIISADFFYWGEQFARTINPTSANPISSTIVFQTERLDGIFDANLGFEYRYTKKLSAFINFNNIAGINYEKYQDYPAQGFNLLGGFTYAF